MAKGLFDRLQQEVEAREKSAGLSMADVLQLPDAERELVNWIVRTGEVSWSAVVARLEQVETAQSLLATLIAKGFIREQVIEGESHYRIHFAHRRKRTLPANLWQALTDKLPEEGEE